MLADGANTVNSFCTAALDCANYGTRRMWGGHDDEEFNMRSAGAAPPYLGGKRRLCPIIFREIDRVIPCEHWQGLTFLDGFLGGGSVSLYAKAQGFSVVSTDIAARSIVIGDALIA